MKRVALLVILAAALVATPAAACQFSSTAAPISGLYPLGKQTATLGTSTAFTFTIPARDATTADNKTVLETLMAVVTVTSGSINTYDNGDTPTTSATAGGQPFGACTGCALTFEVCGRPALVNFKAIGQAGSPTIVVSYYGSAK